MLKLLDFFISENLFFLPTYLLISNYYSIIHTFTHSHCTEKAQ